MTTHRDTTADKAIRAADKGTRTRHAFGCRVDGGTKRHGLKGFVCRRCAEITADRELELLARLDSYAKES